MTKALIIVDEQPDFCEDGALPVQGGNQVCASTADYLYQFGSEYDLIVTSQDWHINPGAHFSDTPDYQDTWPVHCEAYSVGAEINEQVFDELHQLQTDAGVAVVHVFKGQYSAAYSAFEGEDKEGHTLADLLAESSIDRVEVCGLALLHCVKATCVDAVALGYDVRLIAFLTAAVDTERPFMEQVDEIGVGCVLSYGSFGGLNA